MTYKGAITQLYEMRDNELMPAFFKPYFDKIIETLTADVVEVVRCKDCKKREHCRTTNTWAVAPSDDWFCADGERAEK